MLERLLDLVIGSEPFERLLLERARPIVAHAEAGEDLLVAALARGLAWELADRMTWLQDVERTLSEGPWFYPTWAYGRISGRIFMLSDEVREKVVDAYAGLDEVSDLVEASARRGERLLKELSSALGADPIVGDVRGIGLMVGVELVADPSTKAPFGRAEQVTERVVAAARDLGLLLYSSTGHVDGVDGDLVMLGPPFVISDGECDLVVERTAAAVARVSGSR